MSTLSGSHVFALLARPKPVLDLDAVGRRWRRLTACVFDPYRPELHYMRGPGPKWRAKHGCGTNT